MGFRASSSFTSSPPVRNARRSLWSFLEMKESATHVFWGPDLSGIFDTGRAMAFSFMSIFISPFFLRVRDAYWLLLCARFCALIGLDALLLGVFIRPSGRIGDGAETFGRSACVLGGFSGTGGSFSSFSLMPSSLSSSSDEREEEDFDDDPADRDEGEAMGEAVGLAAGRLGAGESGFDGGFAPGGRCTFFPETAGRGGFGGIAGSVRGFGGIAGSDGGGALEIGGFCGS